MSTTYSGVFSETGSDTSMIKYTKRRSLNNTPLTPIYVGIEIEATGICPSFCIYIHDGI